MYDHPDTQTEIYDKLDKRKMEYLSNLINDRLTIWNIKKLDYSIYENDDINNKLFNLLRLGGIRHEEYLQYPVETIKILKERLQK